MKMLATNAILLALSALTLAAAGPARETPADALDSRTTPNSSPVIRSLERRNGMLYCGNFASKQFIIISNFPPPHPTPPHIHILFSS